jgi:hypothetical protein
VDCGATKRRLKCSSWTIMDTFIKMGLPNDSSRCSCKEVLLTQRLIRPDFSGVDVASTWAIADPVHLLVSEFCGWRRACLLVGNGPGFTLSRATRHYPLNRTNCVITTPLHTFIWVWSNDDVARDDGRILDTPKCVGNRVLTASSRNIGTPDEQKKTNIHRSTALKQGKKYLSFHDADGDLRQCFLWIHSSAISEDSVLAFCSGICRQKNALSGGKYILIVNQNVLRICISRTRQLRIWNIPKRSTPEDRLVMAVGHGENSFGRSLVWRWRELMQNRS